jgi:glyoxylase-like metal-dependent hydrolase (beta-lactamase superfamily II)
MQIHRLKTRLVNSYIIEYPDNLLVVDVASGCSDHVAAFITGELGRSLSEIALITCTHDDPDHLGGVADLARLSGAAVALPYASRSLRRKLLNDPQAIIFRFVTMLFEAFRPRAWSMYANPRRSVEANAQTQKLREASRESQTVTQIPEHQQPMVRIKNGQNLPSFPDWQLVHTPGHSWDSCCYYHCESASLLSGDTLLGSRRKGRLVAPAILSNPKHLKSSYQKLASMHITRVFPGHGSMIEGDNLIHKDL